ncbi:MAG: DUF2911 domain-containing protein [Chitinophagaceae bacterium]|nr:DUF2911 domain-containing protein [Chitinophagaceae bacterium]
MKFVQQAILAGLSLLLSLNSFAQTSLPDADKSPLDVSYYPVNYPLLKIQNKTPEPPVARIIYSRPRREGRPIFGNLVEYGKLWRLGANEATELEFYKPVTIAGKKIPKGRYTLYAIVKEKFWTIIINKETDIWGSFKYNQAKDVVRVEVPVETLGETAEMLCMTFEKTKENFNLIIAWENIKVAVPIQP